MSREEEMIKEHEYAMNERIPENIRGLMVSALQWANLHPDWHKASDDLPQKDDMLWSMNVLVTDGESIQFGFYNRENNHWHVLGFEDGYQYNVTHWMYLPKLPEIWNN